MEGYTEKYIVLGVNIHLNYDEETREDIFAPIEILGEFSQYMDAKKFANEKSKNYIVSIKSLLTPIEEY